MSLTALTVANPGAIAIHDVGTMPYREAWEFQLAIHQRVLANDLPAGALILVEHPPVITIGRRPDAHRHLLASPELLSTRGVEIVQTDRGGDITFHGPGQLVAYPIIPLNTYRLSLHDYMRFLEEVVINTVARFGITGSRLQGATGVWINSKASDGPTKICALGIKLRRWVSLHGLALNVTIDLSFFDMINPCGLGRPVTSLSQELGQNTPPMSQVKTTLVEQFIKSLPTT